VGFPGPKRLLRAFGPDEERFHAFEGLVRVRSGQGSLYEGGIRVPLIVKYPGEVEK